ncbi:hypothetical protein [Rummeliibacillus stabekisii]|uniref:Uncharacterized protein n=1 Tax=Rummeliibacillus stabekisii TaxID=241244 RepID=A0A143HFX3_9BACL|nr:hypothetical protein [Rummeliibacillus stabekisii]AMX00377.1 hypothetical protein ATY39_13715 [Rummeliibacillus stabekisii]
MNELYLLIFLLVISATAVTFYLLKKRNKNIPENKSENNDQEHTIKGEVTLQAEELLNIDFPLLVNKTDPSVLKSRKIIEPNDKLKEYSNDLLRLVKSNTPHLPKGKEVYEVVFSEAIQKELKKGTTKIMDSLKKEGYQRAMAVNEQGRIIEHANLKVQKYNPAQLKALAMNTLTVVVSQEHLQEIRKELEKIQISLDRLISMRKNEYYGKAKGSYDYLKRAYTIYQNNEISDRVMAQLESIYRENISNIYSILKDLDDVTVQVSILKKKVWMWQTKEQITNLNKIVTEYNEYESLLNLHFMNVTGCIKLMELYGDSQAVIDYSIGNANELINLFEENKSQFIVELDSYSSEFKTRLTTDNYLLEKQKILKKEIEKVNNISNNLINKSLPEPPEKLYLSVENNEVVSVYKA